LGLSEDKNTLMMNPSSKVALIRMIRLAAKNVITNRNGSFKRYADIKRSIPKNRKKHVNTGNPMRRTHRKIPLAKDLDTAPSAPQLIILLRLQ